MAGDEAAASGAVIDASGALISAGELPPLKKLGAGKVRDLYEVDEKTLLLVITDRISAFDVIMLNGVPGKGKVLNQLTAFWLRLLVDKGIGFDHHMITDDVQKMPEAVKRHAALLTGRCMLVRKLRMLPVEAIVRGYITGSGWVDYQQTGLVCGHTLPAGLRQCERLPEVLFTPSTKADLGEHDENITTEQAAALMGDAKAAKVANHAKQVYTLAAEHAEARGVLVADTKMEFGVALSAGEGDDVALVLGDEVLTPDCSRYWPKDEYAPGRDQASFDKQYVRNYLKEIHFDKKTPIALPDEVVQATLDKYQKIFALLTGAAVIL